MTQVSALLESFCLQILCDTDHTDEPQTQERVALGWRAGDRAAKPSTSPVWNNQSSSSPGAWDDPQWMGKLLLEHHPQRSRLYRALTHCHKQGQCCPLLRTSSMSMSSGPPNRKQPYENSRKEFFKKQHIQVADPPLKTLEMAV